MTGALVLVAACPATPITPGWPGDHREEFQGYQLLTRRYLAATAGRVLQRYGRELEYPAVESPADLRPEDAPWILRTLAAGVMAPRGKPGDPGLFQPDLPVSRLEAALTLDRLSRVLRGYPVRIQERRFPWPRDLPLSGEDREAVDRVLRLRLLRADDGRFRPEKSATRYELAEALDRLLKLMETRPERASRDFPDVAPSHHARRAVRNLYTRGIFGPPIGEPGTTRDDPPPHRLFGTGENRVLPLSERPFQRRAPEIEVAAEAAPAVSTLRDLQRSLQTESLALVGLLERWDGLRVRGQAAGKPLAELQTQVTQARRRVGRIHLALVRLGEELVPYPIDRTTPFLKQSPAPEVKSHLAPDVASARAEAKRLYQRFSLLHDESKGLLPETPPTLLPRTLPLAARATSVAGLAAGGEIENLTPRVSDALLLVPPSGDPVRGPGPGTDPLAAPRIASGPDPAAGSMGSDDLDLGDELGEDFEAPAGPGSGGGSSPAGSGGDDGLGDLGDDLDLDL